MKTKSLSSILALFLVVFMIGSVSAGMELFPSSYSANVNHGSTDSFNFKIYNDGTSPDHNKTLVNITATPSDLSGPATISSSNIDITNIPSYINNQTNSSNIDATISIPLYQTPGVYNGDITISAVNNETGASVADRQITLSINITSQPSLKIENLDLEAETIDVTNNGNVDLSDVSMTTLEDADFTLGFSPKSFSLNAGESRTIDLNSSDAEDLEIGDDNTLTIKAIGGEANDSYDLEVPVDFCEFPNTAEIELDIDDITITKGLGDDDDYWYPLDEVEIEVELDNDGDYDVEDIEIEFCLFDEDESECVLDERDVKLSDDDFDLDEGDRTTIKITFQVDPDEFEEGNEDYKIYVKATGEIDDTDEAEEDEVEGNETCSSENEEIEIITTDKFVIITDIETPESVQCGSEVTLITDAWNIGDDDIDDDEVYLWIFNKELGINDLLEFNEGIDAFDKEKVIYSFEVPQGIKEGYYNIEMTVYDDNDYDSDDIYETDESEDKAEYNVFLKVEGNCQFIPKTTVSASLESEAVAGEEVIISTKITNTDNQRVSYDVSASGYTNWAESVEISDENFYLDSEESKDINLTFKVKEDASGEQDFNIDVSSDGEIIKTQEVAIDFGEKQGFWSSITGAFVSDGQGIDWTIWLIVAINIILVIAIIIVALKLAKR